jgi:hypothetical protein
MPAEISSSAEAFKLLREYADDRLESVRTQIKEAVNQGDYEQAEQYAKRAQALAQLRDDLDTLAERFDDLLESPDVTVETGRLPKGLKTPQGEYWVPILQTLVELGGQADINRVLERVRQVMADKLNKYDLATLSDGETPRWRNTAQWARNAMREEGLIRDDTARGTWAISEKGRNWLKKQLED